MQYSEPLKKEDKPFGDLVQKIALENGFEPFGTVGLHDAAPMPALHTTKRKSTQPKRNGPGRIRTNDPRHVKAVS